MSTFDFRTLQGETLLSNYLTTLLAQYCKFSNNISIYTLTQTSHFRILQKRMLLLWDHNSLTNTAPFKGTELVAFHCFHHDEWCVISKTTMRNLNVIICYSDDEDSSDSKYVCLNLMDNHYSQHLHRQCQIIIFLQPAFSVHLLQLLYTKN